MDNTPARDPTAAYLVAHSELLKDVIEIVDARSQGDGSRFNGILAEYNRVMNTELPRQQQVIKRELRVKKRLIHDDSCAVLWDTIHGELYNLFDTRVTEEQARTGVPLKQALAERIVSDNFVQVSFNLCDCLCVLSSSFVPFVVVRAWLK